MDRLKCLGIVSGAFDLVETAEGVADVGQVAAIGRFPAQYAARTFQSAQGVFALCIFYFAKIQFRNWQQILGRDVSCIKNE